VTNTIYLFQANGLVHIATKSYELNAFAPDWKPGALDSGQLRVINLPQKAHLYTNMKIIAIAFGILCAGLVSVSAAEVHAKISDVHLCCKGCVEGVQKAVAKVEGVKADVDQDDGTVTLVAPDAATLQKAANALVAAGYFGKSDGVKLNPVSGAKGEKVQSLKIEGVHLCCGKCVKAVDHAVKSVAGAKEHTAVKGAKSFEVTGDFNDQELITALQKEGLTGKIAR
jgi:copper chaperone CopZ